MFKFFEKFTRKTSPSTTASGVAAAASSSGETAMGGGTKASIVSAPKSSIYVLKVMSVVLGLCFVTIGLLKLTTIASKQVYRDLVREFVSFSKIFPLANWFGFKVRSKWYRRTIGVLEVVFGFSLAFFPKYKVQSVANLALITLSLLSFYSHVIVYGKVTQCAAPLIFLILLIGRYFMYSQMARNYNLNSRSISKDSMSTTGSVNGLDTGSLDSSSAGSNSGLLKQD